MKVNRLKFRFSEYYSEPEVEQLLEEVSSRGASYQPDRGPEYHLDIPEQMDFTPFYMTLRDCESVAWVADQTFPVVIFTPVDYEG